MVYTTSRARDAPFCILMLSYDDRNELTSEWVWRGIMCMCSTSEVWAPMPWPPASDYGDRDYIHRYGDLHAIIQLLSNTIMIDMHFTIIIKSKMRRKVRHCCSRSLLICTLGGMPVNLNIWQNLERPSVEPRCSLESDSQSTMKCMM